MRQVSSVASAGRRRDFLPVCVELASDLFCGAGRRRVRTAFFIKLSGHGSACRRLGSAGSRWGCAAFCLWLRLLF